MRRAKSKSYYGKNAVQFPHTAAYSLFTDQATRRTGTNQRRPNRDCIFTNINNSGYPISHHRIPPVPAGYGDHLHPDSLRDRHGAVSGNSGGGKILQETAVKNFRQSDPAYRGGCFISLSSAPSGTVSGNRQCHRTEWFPFPLRSAWQHNPSLQSVRLPPDRLPPASLSPHISS